MPKFIVKATGCDYYDAIIEAKDAQEAYEKAKTDNVDWEEVGYGGWQVHGDLIEEISNE